MNQITPPPFRPSQLLHSRLKSAGLSLWLYAAVQFFTSFLLSAGIGFLMGALYSVLITQVEFSYSIFRTGFLNSLFDALSSGMMIVVTLLSALCAWLFLRSRFPQLKEKRPAGKVKAKDLGKGICWMFLASLTFSLLFSLINSLILTPLGHPIAQPDLDYGTGMLSGTLLFAALVIAAPVCEELVFRGCLLRLFENWNPLFAIVFSSFCFGMMHLNIAQGIPTFFMGIVLGYYAWKTGSIRTSIVIHALNNFLAWLSMYRMFETPVNLIVYVLAACGLLLLILSWNRIRAFWKKWKPAFSWKLCFSSIPMLMFTVFFLVYSIGSLFL